jgi:CHAT domain-containing protein/tetratricopeptide (TPR) repeat protein
MGHRRQTLALAALLPSIAYSAAAQQPADSAGQTSALHLRKLTGDDEKRAKELDEQIDKATRAGEWDGVIARTQELCALKVRALGPKHFDTISTEARLKSLRRVASMKKEDRADYQSATIMEAEGIALVAARKCAQAQPLFEKALAIYRRVLMDDAPDTAVGYHSIAHTLNEQQKYAAAQAPYEKALAISRRLFTDDHPQTAESYRSLAINLNAQGKYAEAQPLFEKSLEINRRLFTDDHSTTAWCYNTVAFNLIPQGKYAAAQALLEKALAINRKLGTDNNRETASIYHNLAHTLFAQGKYAAAQPLFEKALAIRRRLVAGDDVDIASTYNSLAANLHAQGNFAAAQPLFEEALAIYRRQLGDDHPDTAGMYDNLAANFSYQGKYAAAQSFFEKALAIRRRLLTDDHPLTALSYDNLAANLDGQEKFAEAQALHDKALAINRKLLTDFHPDTATSYNSLAVNLNHQGKYAEAQPLLEKALAVYHQRLSDDHPLVAYGYYSLAVSLYCQGKYNEAKLQLLRAVKSLNAARLRFAFAGLERAGNIQSMRPILAALLARLGQPVEAWQAIEEDLGRGLLDELAARQDRRLTPNERKRIRELIAELERLDRLAESAPGDLDQSERAKRFDDLKRQRELASIALGEFQTELAQEHGPLAGQVARLEEIQDVLPADAALVAWIDLPPVGPNAAVPAGEHWGVVVRSKDAPCWFSIVGTGPKGLWTDEDRRLPDRVRTALRKRPGAGTAELRPLLDKLRAQRLGPLAQVLANPGNGRPPVRSLIVLPSREMAGIPVEALLNMRDTWTVSYAPSGTVFRYLREQPRPERRGGLLALGDPVLDRPDKSRGESFAPLPGTRREVETLARLFGSDDRPAKALLGSDASESELDRIATSGELARYGFIHLATHGVIGDSDPLRSAVILTQTALPDPLEQAMNHKPVFDGRLSVREIQRTWDLKAELVALSACETALGKESGGEGFVGFTQALLMSGARSVCLSLWNVDDKATSLLMTRFYQNLLGKRSDLSKPMPKAEALQEAKRWLRNLTVEQVEGELAGLERGEVRPLAREKGTPARNEAPARKASSVKAYDHPYYWAAFVLVGDPD